MALEHLWGRILTKKNQMLRMSFGFVTTTYSICPLPSLPQEYSGDDPTDLFLEERDGQLQRALHRTGYITSLLIYILTYLSGFLWTDLTISCLLLLSCVDVVVSF